jgi:hypothetical protein
MIQRNINPKPRFVTLTASVPSTGTFVGVPLATLWRASFFRFPQDSVVHYISINSTFLANGVTGQVIGAIAYGQGQDNVGFNFGSGLDNTSEEILWRDELLNAAAGIVTADKSTQIMMNEFFVHTGTGIGIYVNGLSGNANINATIAFNPIAEWVNFREPTIGARI